MSGNDAVVFKKRSRAGAHRDVRKRDVDDDASNTASSVVTKKSRAEQPTTNTIAPIPDRFGETTVHATERANASARNANTNQEDATRGADWDVADEMARFEETTSKEAPKTVTNDDGTYRGLAQYSKYTQERDDGSSAKIKAKGPIKAPTNVRTITVVDYQPDVCKDYKETGYCGFGDTCKFLHDRSDYLAGWQMNSVGEAADARAGSFGVDLDAEEEDDDDNIPFACLLCREPFTNPIVTLCGDYFCAKCAIARFAKTPKCFACGAKTNGLFNSATRIIERMNKRQATKKEARAERRRMHGLDDGEHHTDELSQDGIIIDSNETPSGA